MSRLLVSITIAVTLLASGPCAIAQLRVVSYNTLLKPIDAANDGQFNAIFNAITNYDANGIAKRVDILSVQEQTPATAARTASLLNALHGVTTYEWDLVTEGTKRAGTVYDASVVELLDSREIETDDRTAHLAHFRPVGYTSPDAEFYLYSLHLRAGPSLDRQEIRGEQVEEIRSHADELGPNKHVVFAGDFNLHTNAEPAYTDMLAPGNAQAFDPIDVNVDWHNNAAVAAVHTQSTRSTLLPDGGANGGLDDRFDFQLVSGELLDGEGLSYLGPTSTALEFLQHSYWAFGNDGVSLNTAVNNTTVGRTLDAGVLDALHDFSDHLPVVADYQLPAVMDVTISPPPVSVSLGSHVELTVTVENIANVVASSGADVLDYTLSTIGALTGSASGAAPAGGGGTQHAAVLDTTSMGIKSGTITVTSDSQAVSGEHFSFPIIYEVLANLLRGDANNDQQVSGLDLITVQENFGRTEAGAPTGLLLGDASDDGLVTGLDLIAVQEGFGDALAASRPVPEPSGVTGVVLLLVIWGGWRGATMV